MEEMACVPCWGKVPPATEREVAEFTKQVPDWLVVDRGGVRQLERVFKFKDFVRALVFTNQVGDLAEEQDHHPAILTEWGKVTVTWWTHAAGGLHKNDFIAAAKTDQLYKSE